MLYQVLKRSLVVVAQEVEETVDHQHSEFVSEFEAPLGCLGLSVSGRWKIKENTAINLTRCCWNRDD